MSACEPRTERPQRQALLAERLHFDTRLRLEGRAGDNEQQRVEERRLGRHFRARGRVCFHGRVDLRAAGPVEPGSGQATRSWF